MKRNLLLIALYIIDHVNTQSYNQPKFCPRATWNPNGITFANSSTIGNELHGIFIDRNDTIYVATFDTNKILKWLNQNVESPEIIYKNSTKSHSIFVTLEGDFYVDAGYTEQVEKIKLSGLNSITTIRTYQSCISIFIDLNNTLYCSSWHSHKVVKVFLDVKTQDIKIAAGNGTSGSTSNMLHNPFGIFVDVNFDLYVADAENHRIQLFRPGQTNGITIAGRNATDPYELNYPTGIVLDVDKYLFIVDCHNHRIVRSSLNGFECVVGCSNSSGTSSKHLREPIALSFDSQGNIFVTDKHNHRIQKFLLTKNSCAISFNQPKLCPMASWNQTAETFVDNTKFTLRPYDIFIDTNDTIYVTTVHLNKILIWFNGNKNSSETIVDNITSPFGIFVSATSQIYIDNGVSYHRVDEWTLNATYIRHVINVNGTCTGLFVDINDTIYCSLAHFHKVIKTALDSNVSEYTIAAGNGSNMSTSNTLNQPYGIFVDRQLKLYVADRHNHRIQVFQPGKSDGETLVGMGANRSIELNQPVEIFMNTDDDMFILDCGSHRILRLGPNSFYCVVGCHGSSGSASNQLLFPISFSFDSHGNIYVMDSENYRIQKFFKAPDSCEISYNQPKLNSCARWNPNAITFAENETVGENPYGIFVDATNSTYIVNKNLKILLVWSQESNTTIRNVSINASEPQSLFVTVNGDVYISDGLINPRIIKWSPSLNNILSFINVSGNCYGLFVDVKNNIYCSIKDQHKIVKKSLNTSADLWLTVANNVSKGSSSNMLNEPCGIFVDTNFNLYVADSKNDRIQLFRSGNMTGETVVGGNIPNTCELYNPYAVTLDANKYLYIVDSDNHRIIVSSRTDFRCLVGCSKTSGANASHLYTPRTLSFDSYGNMFVTDWNNSRIQKFLLETMICNKTKPSHFIAPICVNTTTEGIPCKYLNSLCAMMNPCGNNDPCIDDSTKKNGYICSCSSNSNDKDECKDHDRLCQPNPCWNNGTCTNQSNGILNFTCKCSPGWYGDHCELKINNCSTVQCQNNGVCRSLFMNYTCECVGDNYYYGRHCEFTTTKIKIYKAVSKSFGYVGILAIVTVGAFVVIMDILKYGFDIDPVDKEIKRIRLEKKMKRRTRTARRMTYPNFLLNRMPSSTLIKATIRFHEVR